MMDPVFEHESVAVETLRRLNLNLLYSLDSILNAPSLADAGRQLSLSQPAMSGALRRLRGQFADDLIFFIAGERFLTPLAEALRPRVHQLVYEMEDIFAYRNQFDPKTEQRTIVIAASEAIEIMLLGNIARELLREAPHIHLTVRPIEQGSASKSLIAGADIVILPEQAADATLPNRPLIASHLACMVWNEHPTIGDNLSAEEYSSARHVAVDDCMDSFRNLSRESLNLIAARKVAVRTSFYSTIPRFIIGTDLIATADSWLLQHFSSIMPLRTLAAPFDLGSGMLVAQWSLQRDGDAVLTWLLAELQRNIKRLIV